MKKIFVIALVATFVLAACGQVKANVPNTEEAKATQAVLKEYLTANRTGDANKLNSLYADTLVWMDYGMNDGPYDKGNIDLMNREAMADNSIKAKTESYLLTPDGRFVVLQTKLTMKAKLTGKWVTVPAVAVLEFKDNKITNETWYYDGNAFH